MTWFEALVLGIVQGITEFLPVSSSAHLKIVKYFFEIEASESLLFFDILCHCGTLGALLGYLHKDIVHLLKHNRAQIRILCIGLLPLIPSYFLLKPLRDLLSDTLFLGAALCTTALILLLGEKMRLLKRAPRAYRDALLIGTMQSAALIPGISRSASTIAAAHTLGWSSKEAVRFSFLLAIPTIFGGMLLESGKLGATKTPFPPLSICLIGFFSSMMVGIIVVRWALPLLERGVTRPFAWYCFLLGLFISGYMIYYG